MIRTAEKAVLITACVVGIVLALMFWKPYQHVTTLTLEYVRDRAVKWARAIELKEPFTPDTPLKVEQKAIMITITLPNEEPLTVNASL